MAWLASAFSSIRARCPKKVRRQDFMIDESGGWLVMWTPAVNRRKTEFFRMASVVASNIYRPGKNHNITIIVGLWSAIKNYFHAVLQDTDLYQDFMVCAPQTMKNNIGLTQLL